MRQILIVTGVLGTGTALVFAAAGLVATLFPTGTMVSAGWNGAWGKGGVAVPIAVPAPAPGVIEDGSGSDTTIAPDLEVPAATN